MIIKRKLKESSMRGWADVIQDAELSHDIDDADDQTFINTGRIDEMPMEFDSFMGDDPQEYVNRSSKTNSAESSEVIKDHGQWSTRKGTDGYVAYDNASGNPIARIEGHTDGDWFNVEGTGSSRDVKGVMYQMFIDIVSIEGTPILSGRVQSPDAINFWKKLIQTHQVLVVANGEVLAPATPEKFHKYWSEDENSPSAELQLLLVK